MRQDCWYTDVLLGSLVSAPGQPRSLLLTSFHHAAHPGYDAAALLNDVAIVHLPRDISVGVELEGYAKVPEDFTITEKALLGLSPG